MKDVVPISIAERAGRWLGHAWRGIARKEAMAIRWLVGKGLPVGLGLALFWLVKLTVFGILLFTMFWFAVLIAFVVIMGWLAQYTEEDEEKTPEIRDGHSGVGLYNKDDWRIDMGDPYDP